jgi:dissimilatory sulfite reductase alpha subunit
MTDAKKNGGTPLLDELEKGPWPSFVKELKRENDKPMVKDLIGQLERSFEEKIGHWKHGGLVGVKGYGSGVIGRYSDLPNDFPEVAEFHTVRVNHPSGWFYTSKALRTICDIWERHGSGITNMHGATGDVILLGTKTQEIEPTFAELTAAGFDLGGSGSAMRSPSCCVGPARCEWACYDTLNACNEITQHYQDEMHRPQFPYKFKVKFAGCPNDCVAAVARADLSVIGTWRDDIRVDQAEVRAYAAAGVDVQKEICDLCPSKCMSWSGKELAIGNADCVKCMHCINVMPKALRPGTDRGAVIMLGGKAPIVHGALLSSVIVPFVKLEPPFDDVKELIDAIWELWGENANNRERVGEFVQRIGLGNFLEQIGLPPSPEMVAHPRTNPYVFFDSPAAGTDKENE